VKAHHFSRAKSQSGKENQRRALQAAEKLLRAVGWGFIPGIKAMEQSGLQPLRYAFQGFRLKFGLLQQPV